VRVTLILISVIFDLKTTTNLVNNIGNLYLFYFGLYLVNTRSDLLKLGHILKKSLRLSP